MDFDLDRLRADLRMRLLPFLGLWSTISMSLSEPRSGSSDRKLHTTLVKINQYMLSIITG